jgi:hypothetical protein
VKTVCQPANKGTGVDQCDTFLVEEEPLIEVLN